MPSLAARRMDELNETLFSPQPDWDLLAENLQFEFEDGLLDKASFVSRISEFRDAMAASTFKDVVVLSAGESVVYTVIHRYVGDVTRAMHVIGRVDDDGRFFRFLDLAKMLPMQQNDKGALALCRPLFEATLDPSHPFPADLVTDDCASFA